MQAPADKPATRVVTDAEAREIERANAIKAEVEADAEIVNSGRRLVNRPFDARKDKFVERFRSEKGIEKFPLVADDLVAEREVEWTLFDPVVAKGLMYVSGLELRAAFEQAGEEPPLTSESIAQKILMSDVSRKLGTILQLPLNKVEVDLVLAHVLALGYRWPPRVAVSVARRLTVVIFNRHKFSASEPEEVQDIAF